MKKFLLTTMLTVCCMVASAFDVGDFTYENLSSATTDDYATVKVAGLTAAGRGKTELYIPSSVEYGGTTYRVTRIKESALANYKDITSVTIAYGVKVIEAKAFQGCTKLATVKLASSVYLINSAAFDGCTALKNVYYNRPYPPTSGAEGWYTSTFPANSGMTLYIAKGDPNGIYKFKKSSPAPCGRFANVVKSDDCYDFNFNDANGGRMIVTKAPTKTTRGEMMVVGPSSGANPSSFNITVSNQWISVSGMYCNITAIADSAFLGKTSLTSINFGSMSYLRRVGSGAFRGCSKVTSITSLKADSIMSGAFSGCSALTSVGLQSGVKRMESCFVSCTALTSITIPSTVTYLNPYFVDGCGNLTAIKVDASNTTYSSYNDCLYNKSQTTLYRVPENHASPISYPNALTTIDAYSFQSVKNNINVDIPYGVKTLNNDVFNRMTGLNYIFIPATVSKLGNNLFNGCTGLTQIYINCQTPITVTGTSIFGGAPTTIANLYVPYGKIDAYKSAGWTRFTNYNLNGVQARDFTVWMPTVANSSLGYNFPLTVTSSAPCTIDGVSYDGRVKIVRNGVTTHLSEGVTIPEKVYYRGKNYAVTAIGEEAFSSTNNYALQGCARIDTVRTGAFWYYNAGLTSITLPKAKLIDESAFRQCAKLTSVVFGPDLKRINSYAFHSCSALSQDMIMPYGFLNIGAAVFSGTKVARLLLPGSLSNSNTSTFNGMSSLTELIYNKPYNATQDNWRYEFTGVPTTCKVRVPTGSVNQYRNHTSWKTFGSNITAGGYDYVFGSGTTWSKHSGNGYHMTITSTTSKTVDGVTYDGTAKYVYYPDIENKTSFSCSNYETDNTYGGGKKYLITEIGDSALYNCKATSQYGLSNLKNLQRIGHRAFYGSKISGNLVIPASVTSIGAYSFYNCASLTELLVMPTNSSRTWYNYIYGGNASTFYCYIPSDVYYTVKGFTNTTVGDFNRLNTFVTNFTGMRTFSVDYAADYQSSNIEAYTVGQYDRTTATAYVDQCNQAPAGTGVLLDNLKAADIYRIKRATGTPSQPNNLLVGTVGSTVNVYNQSVGFYFNNPTKTFKRPTGNYTVGMGSAYLRLASGFVGSTTEVQLDIYPIAKKGDIDGNGAVDVQDLSLLIDVVLGKRSATDPAIKGDIHLAGNTGVDVQDISILIDLVLGK